MRTLSRKVSKLIKIPTVAHHDLSVCLMPLEIAWGEKQTNIENLVQRFGEIPAHTDLVVLPETFSTGYPAHEDSETVKVLAEGTTGATITLLKQLAYKHNTAVAGSFLADDNGKYHNRAFFIEPTGDAYFADKKHLFSISGEDEILAPGDRRMLIRYRGWNISMIVCYDLRFPVWCRNAGNRYDLLLVVANWPQSRVKVWRKLAEARAIENLSYVCAVDCRGTDTNGTVYDGTSMAIDYKGDSFGTETSSGMVTATLSHSRLEDFRRKFPVHLDADKFQLL